MHRFNSFDRNGWFISSAAKWKEGELKNESVLQFTPVVECKVKMTHESRGMPNIQGMVR